MQGGQSKALIILSKAQGWDPTELLNGVDKAPGVPGTGDNSVAAMLPTNYLDGADSNIGAEKVTWNAPNSQYEHESRGSRNSNPFPGMPGAKG